MEEISSRATIFELGGLGSEKRKYLKWLLAQSAAPKTKIESVITVAMAIAENVRDEQRKFIKHNHLVANLLSFHTLVTMTKALQQMIEEGYTLDVEALSTLSPYRTEHINRFGNYVINPDRLPEPLEQHLGFSLAPVST
jgi:hypothetical protein